MKKIKCLLFPNQCSSGIEHSWAMKHVCPYCLKKPFENLCNKEYIEKYPANNVLSLGHETVYICDRHLDMLIDEFQEISRERMEVKHGEKETG